MKFAPSALQWDKFSIIGHSMGECSVTPQTVCDCPKFDSYGFTFFFICVFYSGGHVAGMVVPFFKNALL